MTTIALDLYQDGGAAALLHYEQKLLSLLQTDPKIWNIQTSESHLKAEKIWKTASYR